MADRDRILDTLSLYAWGYDENDMDVLGNCFTDDARMALRIEDGDVIGPFEGKEAILGLMKGSLEQQTDQRRHLTTNIIFKEETDTTATVISYLTLTAVENSSLSVLSTGVYTDRLVLDDGTWRIEDRFLQLDAPY
jgi:hypothetical protein